MTTYPLRRLRLRLGDEHREGVTVALQPFELGGERYLPVPAEAEAVFEAQRAVSGDVFRLTFGSRLHGPCMRCLQDAAVGVEIDAREYHATADDSPQDLRSEYVVGGELLLSQWARDSIATALPEQILCRRDCSGLCPVCGKDLNEEPHGHEETVADPRWAALEPLRDAS
ncbi:MAG: DUF177 domain-containing protein [Thermoleophilia bacterium]|nr:DUF177 domain-containing protein [Thermoleophilia bacterium]